MRSANSSFLFLGGNGFMKFEDGTLGYIDFRNAIGGEINQIHLAVLFNIPAISNVVFAIPLTSPKVKHFKSLMAFENRNYLEIIIET